MASGEVGDARERQTWYLSKVDPGEDTGMSLSYTRDAVRSALPRLV